MKSNAFKFVVLGDLHLDPSETETFDRARTDVVSQAPDALVCLGDLGNGAASGTRDAFEAARAYLASFETVPYAILGNHDLERVEQFASDAQAVEAFCEAFDVETPYAAIELGSALGLLLSSTGFRDNRGYKHEVSIDDVQFHWLRETLEANRERPTIVFSHAPPLGSQLRVLQYPHLRAGNAWLNQSNGPGRFMALLGDHPQVRLWFSGHNHLGQQYEDSASLVGRCLFVHTGVIGRSSRDGAHHSRVVAWDESIEVDRGEIRVDTLDHATQHLCSDLRFDLRDNCVTREALSPAASNLDFIAAPRWDAVESRAERWSAGRSAFAIHRDMLVEFDTEFLDPVGVVEDWVGRSRVALHANRLVLKARFGTRRISPNVDGYYFQVPARNPRILNELREVLRRYFVRRTR